MNTLNKIKEELEVLKSWGIETIPIDKILDMIGENDHHTEDTVFYPSETEKDGVDKYFKYIPMYVNTDRTYPHYNDYTLLPYSNFPHHNTGSGVPNSYIIVS